MGSCPEAIKLSDIQGQILLSQELAPESTAYIQTITINKKEPISITNLARDLTSQFPILVYVISPGGQELKFKQLSDYTKVVYQVKEKDGSFAVGAIPKDRLPLPMNESYLFMIGQHESTLVLHIHQLLVDSLSCQMIAEFIHNYPHVQSQEMFVPDVLPANGFVSSNNDVNPELELEIRNRFAANSEFMTCLQPHLASTIVQKLEASTIEMKMDIDYQEISTLFDLSPEEFFLGCFVLTLRRYLAGETPMSFCMPVSTREPRTQNTVGPFFNILPITTNLDMDTDLSGFFGFLKKEISFFIQFKDYAFSKLFQKLQEDNESYDLRPYTHMFSYEQINQEGESVIRPTSKNPKVPLSLQVTDYLNGNTASVSLTWAKPLMEAEVGRFFLSNFINCSQMIAKAGNSPDAGSIRLQQFEIMSVEERALRRSFNRLNETPPEYASVTALFERNASRSLEKVAIYETSAQYTYSELREASCKIADKLLSKFSQAQMSSLPVLLVMEKNFDCVASVFGIWRAGGYFIPVDSNMQERLVGLKQEASSYICLLTNLQRDELHKEASGWEVLTVRELLENPVRSTSNEDNNKRWNGMEAGPETPAYMTMTSGSTGMAKSCVNSHGGLFKLITAASQTFDLDEGTNVLQWVPFSFDVFIADLVKGLLCTNGSLTMVTQLERFQVDKIASLISKHGVTFIHMTPQFVVFACQEQPGMMKGVKAIALGGEALTWKVLELIREHLEPTTELYNCYGLTEATIESTVFHIPHDYNVQNYKGNSRYVPIGRPLPGIRVCVFDAATFSHSPIGASGMLAITGITVATGDRLTTKLINGVRWLFTGDSASWLSDGNMEFKGRDEMQTLKIRGLRINCEELESAIMKTCSDVDGAVALTVEIGDGICLAAALQTENTSLNTQDVQEQLRQLLPYYMVPQILFLVPKFPLTVNGKIDRKALKHRIESENKQLYSQPQQLEQLESSENDEVTKIEEFLINKLSLVSGRPYSSINGMINLRDQGFTSFQLIKFSNMLVKEHLANFDGISDLFTFPTLTLLAKKLVKPGVQKSIPKERPKHQKVLDGDNDKICIVGMSFRLPGNISSIPDLWNNLSDGTCFVKPFPKNRSEDVLTRMSQPFTSDCVAASFFDTVDQFDHEFFKIAPNEAKHMCPEQRMFLEVGTEALVDAGYNLASLDNANIGVYATASDVEYGIIDKSLDGVAVVGRQSSVVPSRLSYTFNLKGGNYVVDTACSAALTILEQAVRDLKAGQCDAAVVGGANVYLYPAKDGLMGTNLIHSPTSSCRAFDESSDGTVSGEGVFAYVLKRTSTAKANSDYIYSQIESICSNSVGRGNGITAPSVDSQVTVIQNALEQAHLTIDEIDLLETHGTGTVLGDQIELCALSTVFSSRSKLLTLGATKPNFGHLDMAAGFLSILKATCSLTFNMSPSMAHLKKPSKYLDKSVFKTSASELRDPKELKNGRKGFAGVSAYGLSGTNCHAVLSFEGHKNVQTDSCNPEAVEITTTIHSFLLPVEPRRIGIEEQCGVYSRWLQFYMEKQPFITLPDICGTQINNLVNFGQGQKVAALSASSIQELIKKLDAIHQGVIVVGASQIKTLDVCAMSEQLPKAWSRVPAFPKFFFKKFRHWLNPVEPTAMAVAPNSRNIPAHNYEIAALESLLRAKSAEVYALMQTAHKLEQTVHQFSHNFMKDLLYLPNYDPTSANKNAANFVSGSLSEHKDNDDHIQLSGEEDSSISRTDSGFLSSSPSPSQNDLTNLTYEKTYLMISKIWEDCLGTEDIKEADIFRDLGGDSLLTVQMMKTVSATFGIKLKAADAFANPTISSVASLVFNACMDYSPSNKIKFSGMPMKMIMFPGQGSQKLNMCSAMSSSPAALKVFQEAKKITGIDVLSLCSDPESFKSTEFVQVALFVGSLAKIAQLQVEDPKVLEGIRAVGGLSVGEFAALVFAEAINFKDALEIVHFRGKAMQECVDSEGTGMVSIFGPKKEDLEVWLTKSFPKMTFSTILGDNQFAVGGPLESCERLTDLLTRDETMAERLGIIDVRLLRVAGAFHTEYMKTASVKTARLLDDLNIHYPKMGIVMNADGLVAMNKDDIRFNLKKQTSNPVMWRDSMITAHQLGIREFVEISPSSVLTPILNKRIQGISNSTMSLIRF